MKKVKSLFLSLCFLNLFISGFASSQTESTIITSIYIQNKEIPRSNWENLSIKPSDSVTINFKAITERFEPNKILFHVFLNGKIINLDNLQSDNISLSKLPEGNYILKIQGYTNEGWEAKPVVQQFIVGNVQIANNQAINEENDTDYTTIFYYSIIAIIIIIITSSLVLIKKISTNKNQSKLSKDPTYKKLNSIVEVKEKDYKKKNVILNEKIDELTQSVSHLKKEFKKLDDHNKFLKQQVHELKSYVADLEKANAQLVEQKEKLAESKHKLEELQAKKEKLFATAVHDIKNPAAAIKGYVELLEGYDLNAVEQQEIMQFLTDTSNRILELAQQMSVVIAKEEPEQELNFQKSSIKSIIDSVCNQNMATAKKKNIKIINNSSTHCPEILFDPEKIFEVMDNLISNAIKYSKPETVVQVRSYFNDKKVFVEVVDGGVGLMPEDMPKLFIKGAKLSAKPTASEESSGLGLWIVKNIIDDHGGKIWATSKQGVGSTFTFELPITNGLNK